MPPNDDFICNSQTGWCVNKDVAWLVDPPFHTWENLPPNFEPVAPKKRRLPKTSKAGGRKRPRRKASSDDMCYEVTDGVKITDFSGVAPPPAPKTWEEGKRQGLPDWLLTEYVDLGLTKPPNPLLMRVAHRSVGDKAVASLRITEVYLPVTVKTQFRQLFSPENLGITVGVMGLWLASHEVGVGFAVDVILVAAGAITMGRQAAEAAGHLYDYIAITATAETVGDLHRASKHLSEFIGIVGIEVFLALIMKGGSSAARRVRRGRIPIIEQPISGSSASRMMMHEASHRTGIAAPAFFRLRTVAQRHGVTIRIRPPRPGHGRLRTLGHRPKPEWAKMKTRGELDSLIGGPQGEGVAFFEPKRPSKKLQQSNPSLYRQAMKQFEKRQREWTDPRLRKVVEQRIKLGDVRRTPDGLLVDAKSGKAIVSDYDGFDILDASGNRLTTSDPKYWQIYRDLKGGSVGLQHGFHMNWSPVSIKQLKMKYRIAWDHMHQERLVEFDAGGNVALGFYDLGLPWWTATGRGGAEFEE